MSSQGVGVKDIAGYEGLYKISDCCNGKRKTAFKYKWRWAE